MSGSEVSGAFASSGRQVSEAVKCSEFALELRANRRHRNIGGWGRGGVGRGALANGVRRARWIEW